MLQIELPKKPVVTDRGVCMCFKCKLDVEFRTESKAAARAAGGLTVADVAAELVDGRAGALGRRRHVTGGHRTENLRAVHARTLRTLVHQPALSDTVHLRVVRTVLQRTACATQYTVHCDFLLVIYGD